jgi:hypothetical protein
MDRHEYYGILIGEWLERDFFYRKWLETKDPEFKAIIEEEYSLFNLVLLENGTSFNSNLVKRYIPCQPGDRVAQAEPNPDDPTAWEGQPFSGELLLSISMDKLRFSSDWKHLLDEVKSFVKFELDLREAAEASSTALNYIPNREKFLRDIEIFKFYERHLSEPPEDVARLGCDKFEISRSSYFTIIKRMKKLLWRKHGKDHPTVPGAPYYIVPRIWLGE